MTEEEWCISSDPQGMLHVLRGCSVATERKLRLYACACALQVIERLENSTDYQRILATAERMAEGVARSDEVRQASEEGVTLELTATNRLNAGIASLVSCTLDREGHSGAMGVVAEIIRHEWRLIGQPITEPYAALLRCIFGNPYRGLNVGFRPVTLDPAWRTSTVLALAHGIYDERAFDRMPILADALQDAGCDNGDILSHCRTETVHARGCWVVDAVLGKA